MSAILGAVLGVFFTSTWQVAVETAQALAGVVEYPPDNPFYRYHAGAWSLLHQFLAALVWLGVDERILSILLSGALCAATFGGMTLCCHAICGRGDIAVLTPLVWFSLFRDANAYGIVYPLFITGTHHTYGILGRAVALWLAGLAAHRYVKSVLFTAAVMPALHLTWGIYAGVVVACAWLCAAGDRTRAVRAWPWFVAGAVVTAASFGLQRYWTFPLPTVDPSTAQPYLQAFLIHWDGHRVPMPILVPGTLLVAAVAVGGTAFLTVRALVCRIDRASSARMIYAVAAVAGFTSLGMLLMAQFPLWLPTQVAIAMPGRFANFALLLFPILLLGTIGRIPGRAGTALLLALALYIVWNWLFEAFLSSDRFGWDLAHWIFLLPLFSIATFLLIRGSNAKSARHQNAIVAAITVAIASGVFVYPQGRVEPLFYRTEDPVLAQARNGTGLIITGPGLELVQLRTGRPILLNTGGLDQLPYIPASGPAMNEALEQVYGISILQPPDPIRKRRIGALPRDVAVDLFARRSLEEWQTIAKRFGDGSPVSVLVQPPHKLSLIPTATSDQWRLYDIPLPAQEKFRVQTSL